MGSAAAGAVAVAAATADVTTTTRDELDGRRQRLTNADICTANERTASQFALWDEWQHTWSMQLIHVCGFTYLYGLNGGQNYTSCAQC